VEAILPGIVVPKQTPGGHVGHVLGELDKPGHKWDVGLRFHELKAPNQPPHGAVQALMGILPRIYPDPDRPPAGHHRTPTAQEARIVVQLATAVVQWARDGEIRKKP